MLKARGYWSKNVQDQSGRGLSIILPPERNFSLKNLKPDRYRPQTRSEQPNSICILQP